MAVYYLSPNYELDFRTRCITCRATRVIYKIRKQDAPALAEFLSGVDTSQGEGWPIVDIALDAAFQTARAAKYKKSCKKLVRAIEADIGEDFDVGQHTKLEYYKACETLGI